MNTGSRAGIILALLLAAGTTGASDEARRPADFGNPEAQATVGREEPFVARPLQPTMGRRWIGNAIAYGPHRDGQFPGGPSPTRVQVREDLRIMSRHWNLLRVYGAVGPADTILQVIHDDRLPMKVLLGVWIRGEEKRDSTGAPILDLPEARAANRSEVEAAVRLTAAHPDIVVGVCVGNETQVSWSANRVPTALLVDRIREIRARVRVPVTTADDVLYWDRPESRGVAQEIDFVTTHLHPLWAGQSLDSALAWSQRSFGRVCAMHPERTVVIGEIGWATQRLDTGEQGKLMKGQTGEAEQKIFCRSVAAWVKPIHITTFFFEAFDENWKGGGDPGEVEKHWGFYRADRTPKLVTGTAK